MKAFHWAEKRAGQMAASWAETMAATKVGQMAESLAAWKEPLIYLGHHSGHQYQWMGVLKLMAPMRLMASD